MAIQQSDVLIHSGMHQFQHGRISSIDTNTEIPFAHVTLRGTKGKLLTTRGAYVPLKYCVEIDAETCAALAAASKESRKARRAAKKAQAESSPASPPTADSMSWE